MTAKINRPRYRAAKCCATCSLCHEVPDWHGFQYYCQYAAKPSKRLHAGKAYDVEATCVCDAWQRLKGGV